MPGGFKDFREIVAWQRARDLKLLADALLAKPEVSRRFKYCDHAHDVKLVTDEEFNHAEHTARRALKAANGLIRFLESNPDPPPPPYKPNPPEAP